LLTMVILAAISLAGALTMLMLSRRKSKAGNVLIDDAGESTLWEEDELEDASSESLGGQVILDGTSVGPNASSDAREVGTGRDDGVFGAPQLDGYGFENWSPQEVQSSLDAGWTIEQLREKYEKEFS